MRVRSVDVMAVICGQYTHWARGVSEEVRLAQQEHKPYFLLWGYADKTCFSGRAGNPPVVDNEKSLLREGMCILTGSRNDQPSVETHGNGVFTTLVVDALDGGAANLLGGVSAPAVYTFVEAALGAWNQRPLFKANLSTAIDLRKSAPPIAGSILRRLPALFPLPAEEMLLDPSYEKTHASAEDAKVAPLQVRRQTINCPQ